MKPLIVLLTTFAISTLVIYLFAPMWEYVWAGNIAMSCMLLFTALGHFVFIKGMAKMLPGFMPFKKGIIGFTGLAEVAGAIGLLIPYARRETAIILIVFFILILPANIFAALKKVDYQKGNNEGPGIKYLWFRVPLQIFFIVWIVWFSL